MANNKLVNGDVLQALITELEKRSIGSLESTGSAITIKDLAGNTKDTLDVSIPSFTGATDSENGTSGLVPIPTAGKQDMALCGDATFKVLPIAGGGTGADNATAARTNLGIDTTYFNPTGTIIAFAGNTLPKGYLLCDGSQVSRTIYKKLFNVIGTTYGSGNGSTTFNLPNLTDKFIQGSDTAGTVKSAGLPNITGRIGRSETGTKSKMPPFWLTDIREGAFASSESGGPFNDFADTSLHRNSATQYINFNASDSNSIYGNSETVQPPALTMRYIIKY